MAKLSEEHQKRVENSKKLDELVTEAEFLVQNVYTRNEAMVVSPKSEVKIGIDVHWTHYPAGYVTKSSLYVRPDDSTSPVKILEFNGQTNVRGGDYITVSMPIYEASRIGKHQIYEERGLRHTERAIEIKIWDSQKPDRKMIRNDRSVDFDDYQKSKA